MQGLEGTESHQSKKAEHPLDGMRFM